MMRRAVLISIRPEWVELILSGKKTLEIRKTAPKLVPPFKCYIYETKGFERVGNDNLSCVLGGRGRGMIVGEFVCDKVYETNCFSGWDCQEKGKIIDHFTKESCLEEDKIAAYAAGKAVYGWHISSLVVYDKAKALCDIHRDCSKCGYINARDGNCDFVIKRPPQSWRYLECL